MKCYTCSNGAAFGNKCCLDCLKKARDRSSKRYLEMKKNRKCKGCLIDITHLKSILCEQCKENKRNIFNQRKKDGDCVTCGVKKSKNGLKCEDCNTAYVTGVNKLKQKRLQDGLCAYCNNVRVGTQLCKFHYLKFTAKTHLGSFKKGKDLEDLFNKQQGKCPYTGRSLTLGVDSSIDHIFPKCLGGSKEIDNLQWVYGPINFMKADQKESDFLELVKEVYINKIINKVNV